MERRTCFNCRTSSSPFLKTALDTEAFCDRCLVWCSQAALIHHGPLSNFPSLVHRRNGRKAPPLSAYPPSWQVAYRLSTSAFDAEMDSGMPHSPQGKAVADAFYTVLIK